MRCFSSAGSLYLAYVFSQEYPLRGGFPHSDICGSKLVCQLPAAFRRLPRPSSPVIAKASTTCTYSLDPITLSTLTRVSLRLQLPSALGCRTSLAFCFEQRTIQSIKPSRSTLARHPKRQYHALSDLVQDRSLYFFQIFKEQPNLSLTS